MNVSIFTQRDYENIANWTLGESKPNSNPISKKPKKSANVFITKDYRKKDDFADRKNKPNLVRRRRIANERKLNFNKGLQKKR